MPQGTKFTEIANNPENFEFKVNGVVIKPRMQIFNKEGKLITEVADMDMMTYEGSMNQEYADKFFKDMTEATKEMFIRYMLKNEEKQDGPKE